MADKNKKRYCSQRYTDREVWKTVSGYEPAYQLKVSSSGRVCLIPETKLDTTGRQFVHICGRDIPIDYLVASAFIPNRTNSEMPIHIDGNLSNSSVANLRWEPHTKDPDLPGRIYSSISMLEYILHPNILADRDKEFTKFYAYIDYLWKSGQLPKEEEQLIMDGYDKHRQRVVEDYLNRQKIVIDSADESDLRAMKENMDYAAHSNDGGFSDSSLNSGTIEKQESATDSHNDNFGNNTSTISEISDSQSDSSTSSTINTHTTQKVEFIRESGFPTEGFATPPDTSHLHKEHFKEVIPIPYSEDLPVPFMEIPENVMAAALVDLYSRSMEQWRNSPDNCQPMAHNHRGEDCLPQLIVDAISRVINIGKGKTKLTPNGRTVSFLQMKSPDTGHVYAHCNIPHICLLKDSLTAKHRLNMLPQMPSLHKEKVIEPTQHIQSLIMQMRNGHLPEWTKSTIMEMMLKWLDVKDNPVVSEIPLERQPRKKEKWTIRKEVRIQDNRDYYERLRRGEIDSDGDDIDTDGDGINESYIDGYVNGREYPDIYDDSLYSDNSENDDINSTDKSGRPAKPAHSSGLYSSVNSTDDTDFHIDSKIYTTGKRYSSKPVKNDNSQDIVDALYNRESGKDKKSRCSLQIGDNGDMVENDTGNNPHKDNEKVSIKISDDEEYIPDFTPETDDESDDMDMESIADLYVDSGDDEFSESDEEYIDNRDDSSISEENDGNEYIEPVVNSGFTFTFGESGSSSEFSDSYSDEDSEEYGDDDVYPDEPEDSENIPAKPEIVSYSDYDSMMFSHGGNNYGGDKVHDVAGSFEKTVKKNNSNWEDHMYGEAVITSVKKIEHISDEPVSMESVYHLYGDDITYSEDMYNERAVDSGYSSGLSDGNSDRTEYRDDSYNGESAGEAGTSFNHAMKVAYGGLVDEYGNKATPLGTPYNENPIEFKDGQYKFKFDIPKGEDIFFKRREEDVAPFKFKEYPVYDGKRGLDTSRDGYVKNVIYKSSYSGQEILTKVRIDEMGYLVHPRRKKVWGDRERRLLMFPPHINTIPEFDEFGRPLYDSNGLELKWNDKLAIPLNRCKTGRKHQGGILNKERDWVIDNVLEYARRENERRNGGEAAVDVSPLYDPEKDVTLGGIQKVAGLEESSYYNQMGQKVYHNVRYGEVYDPMRHTLWIPELYTFPDMCSKSLMDDLYIKAYMDYLRKWHPEIGNPDVFKLYYETACAAKSLQQNVVPRCQALNLFSKMGRGKSVRCWLPDGQMMVFPQMNIAADATGCSVDEIRRCCLGEAVQVRGIRWEFVDIADLDVIINRYIDAVMREAEEQFGSNIDWSQYINKESEKRCKKVLKKEASEHARKWKGLMKRMRQNWDFRRNWVGDEAEWEGRYIVPENVPGEGMEEARDMDSVYDSDISEMSDEETDMIVQDKVHIHDMIGDLLGDDGDDS